MIHSNRTNRENELVNVEAFMLKARNHAEVASKCRRRKVCCYILDEAGSVLSIGHNGNPDFAVDCLNMPCIGSFLPRGEHTTAKGLCHAYVHAEEFAITNLPEAATPHYAIVTCPPCSECAELLVDIGVCEIVVPNDMLDRDNSEIFCRNNGVTWSGV